MNFFHPLQSTSTLTEHLLNKVKSAKEEDWQDIIEMSCLMLSVDDFKTEPEIIKLIEKFNCQPRLAIYRFAPNTCYKWHIDHPGRKCCINMLIDGYDSLTMFGTVALHGKYTGITKLIYEPNKYTLLNVHAYHTVFNFSQPRYLLSIGVPSPTTYEEVKQYIIDNNL